MQDGQVKERILKEALELIEDNKKATYDEIENRLIEDTPEGEERLKIKERLLQAKLSRAAKIAKTLSKDWLIKNYNVNNNKFIVITFCLRKQKDHLAQACS